MDLIESENKLIHVNRSCNIVIIKIKNMPR